MKVKVQSFAGTDAGFVRRAGAGIERVLMRRNHQNRRIVIEDVLRSVAVMHIEIHDCDS